MKQAIKVFSALLLLAGNCGPALSQSNRPDEGNTGPISEQTPVLPANLPAGIKVNYLREIQLFLPVKTLVDVQNARIMGNQIHEKTDYSDGFARTIQTVVKKYVGTYSKDIVKHYNYDAFGRITMDILPFGKSDRSDNARSRFDLEINTDLLATYSDLGYQTEGFLYSKNVYEESPLRRVLERQAPGTSWTGQDRDGVGTKHGLTMDASREGVRIWRIAPASGSTPFTSSEYAAGEICSKSVTDEDNQTVREYCLPDGKTIMKEDNENKRTYYVYDLYGRLRITIPPKATEEFANKGWSVNQSVIDNLCFVNEFDERGNLVSSKKPGIEATEYVYNDKNQLLFVQDAMQRTQGTWLFNKYDTWGRLIQTGTYSGGSILPPNAPEIYDYVTQTPVYYHQEYASSFPGCAFHINYYYDSYDYSTVLNTNGQYTQGLSFISSIAPLTDGYTTAMSLRTHNLLTGVLASTSDNQSKLLTVNYYNKRAELIQVRKQSLSDNWSTLAMGYNFKGEMIKSVLIAVNVTVQKKYAYDLFGRLRSIGHKINSAVDFRPLVTYRYDDMGRLASRSLGSMHYPVEYEYNIRNWVTGINKKYVNNNAYSLYFGEEIFYDKGYGSTYLNGRIAGIKWRHKGAVDEVKSYGYLYDQNSQLLHADFALWNTKTDPAPTWSNSAKDFTTSNISYDQNGNLLTMKHMGMDASKTNIIILDDLTYSYDNGTNRLTDVTESGASQSTDLNVHDHLSDFRDGSSGNDYSYDANGNLSSDGNRGITNIDNYWLDINKPLHIEYASGQTVDYIYDALGTLLQKKTVQTVEGITKITVFNYMYEITYQNWDPVLIAHEEGRIRIVKDEYDVTGYAYDYYLRDHIDNVRSIITEDGSTDIETYEPGDEGNFLPGFLPPTIGEGAVRNPIAYIATSELINDPYEQEIFDQIGETRDIRPFSSNPEDQNSAHLSAAQGKVLGPGMMLKVMAGDQVQLGAEAFYFSGAGSTAPVPIQQIVTSLLSALSGAAGMAVDAISTGSQAAINGQELTMALSTIQGSGEDTTQPRAYLNYIMFDESMHLIPEASGAIQVAQANAWESMEVPRFDIPQNGYLYIFTSNQSQMSVRTDNLYVMHYTSRLLEESSYYPFGLSFDVRTSFSVTRSNERYNTQRIQQHEFSDVSGESFGLDWYDFMARTYDPQIGRWLQADPMEQHASPFLAMGNNPVSLTDPLGLLDGEPGGPYASSYSITNENGQATWVGVWDRYVPMTASEYMMYAQNSIAGGGDRDLLYSVGSYSNFNSNWISWGQRTNNFNGSNAIAGAPREANTAGGWIEPANTWNGGIGLLAGAVENLSGKTAIGTNGKFYSSGWGGNQYVSTARVAKVGKVLGNVTLVVGTFLDIKGVFNYYNKGSNDPNAVHPGTAGLNLGIGAWGLISIPTAIGSGLYYSIDAFYPGGFPAAMERSAEVQNRDRRALGFYPKD